MVLGAQSEEDVGLTGRSGVIHDIMNLSLEWSVDDMGLARGVQRPDSLCAALTLSFKQQIENPHNALPYH